MSVVRINAIEVPEGMGEILEQRFAARLSAVDQSPGFEGFELLRPTGDGEQRYFVVTHWASAQDFENWVNSDDFGRGHSGANAPAGEGSEAANGGHPHGAGSHGGGHPHGGGAPGGPVSTGSSVLEFDVVLQSGPK